ncbi:diguanylate cyclase [Atrimonas thermophila]|uniref:GGDEF domain-containing protein n=1 Tax=Atrimonas thermophila TaxID=3064161 RepID=UPI00399C83ED
MVITAIEKREIAVFVIQQILKAFTIVAVLSLLLGWVLSSILSERVTTSINKLKEHVERIISETPGKAPQFKYPENEIGAILQNIEQLTQTEPYQKNLQLESANQQLEQLSITDQLTRLYNRCKMYAEFKKEIDRAQRYGSIFSIIMFGLDNFKDINDTLDHQVGDVVLSKIAQLARSVVRSVDIVSRWGGDEFLILCPETTLREAYKLAEYLRHKITECLFPEAVEITASIGVCEYVPGESEELF